MLRGICTHNNSPLSVPTLPPLEGEGSDAWPFWAIAKLGGVIGREVTFVAPPHPQSLPLKGREAKEFATSRHEGLAA